MSLHRIASFNPYYLMAALHHQHPYLHLANRIVRAPDGDSAAGSSTRRCPLCSSALRYRVKNSSLQPFIGCQNFYGCGYTEPFRPQTTLK